MTTLFPDFGLDETGTKGRRPARPSLEASGQARLRPPSSRRASTEPRLLTNPSRAGSELILSQADDGPTPMQYRFEDDTLWRSQAPMAELFQVTTQNVTLHLNEIFAEDDLSEGAICKGYLQIRQESTPQLTRSLRHYSRNRWAAIFSMDVVQRQADCEAQGKASP